MGTTTEKPQIADRVNSLREQRGIPVSVLAADTGIPRTTLTRKLPRGDDFTISELNTISDRLSVPIIHWFESI